MMNSIMESWLLLMCRVLFGFDSSSVVLFIQLHYTYPMPLRNEMGLFLLIGVYLFTVLIRVLTTKAKLGFAASPTARPSKTTEKNFYFFEMSMLLFTLNIYPFNSL